MKRYRMSVLVAAVLALSGAACGDDTSKPTNGDTPSSQVSDAQVSLNDEVVLIQGPVAGGGQLFKVGAHTVTVKHSAWVFDGPPRITDTATVWVESQEVTLRRTMVYDDNGPVPGDYTYRVIGFTF